MILPTDFALPALPYLLVLVVGSAVTAGALYYRRPAVTEATVTAFAPWMAAGGTLYATYQAGLPPEWLAPLVSSPAVYVSVGIIGGLVWAAIGDRSPDSWELAGAPAVLAVGGVALLLGSVLLAAVGSIVGTVEPTLSVSIGIAFVSIVVTVVAWTGLQRLRGRSATGTVGGLVVFGHTLDGVSTAVGYDLLGFGEQTPLSRAIIEFGGALPTAELVGAGWLFAVVKVVLALVIVVLFEEYVRSEPTEGYLLLGFVAAVGLGPGFHNLVLFSIL